MSQENVEIVRKAYEAIVRRDLEAGDALMQEHLAPDFEFESVLTGESYTGAQRVRDLAADLWETVDYTPATEEIFDLDEHVVVVLRISGRGLRSLVPVSRPVAVVLTFEDERIVRGKSFTSRADALEAFGPSHS